VQEAEKALEKLIAESPAHQFVQPVAWPKAVPMTQAENLSSDLRHIRLLKDFHAELLKIMEAPDVVIALKKAHFDPGIHQIQQSREHPDITFRDHVVVLVPKIPDVSKEIKSSRPVLGNRLKESHEAGLPVRRIIDIKAKMDIRHKIHEGSGCHQGQ